MCGIPHTHFQFSVWYLVPHTLSIEFRGVCGTLKIRVCGTIVSRITKWKGYAEELLLQPRQETIRAILAIGQGSSSAPLALSGSVNCVGASLLRPPPPSEPSVGCGVGTALPNGVARCVLDAHPDKQVRALVAMTTLIQQHNAPWNSLEEAVMMSARAQLHGSASPDPSYIVVTALVTHRIRSNGASCRACSSATPIATPGCHSRMSRRLLRLARKVNP